MPRRRCSRGTRLPRLVRSLTLLLGRVAEAAWALTVGGRRALIGVLPTFGDGPTSASGCDDRLCRATGRWNTGLRSSRAMTRSGIRIAGVDPLEVASEDVAVEGATTSFQVHLRVNPADFTRTYNAVQLATAPVLAVAGNSPTFLGHQLWEETRIALFKQSIDAERGTWRGPRRRLARSRSGQGGCGADRSHCSAKACGCTRRCCLREGYWPAGDPPDVRDKRKSCATPPLAEASAAPGHGVALEPGHLRSRLRRPPAHRDAGPAGRSDRDRHARQRRLPDRRSCCGWPSMLRAGPTRRRSSAPSMASTVRPSTAWPPSGPGRPAPHRSARSPPPPLRPSC